MEAQVAAVELFKGSCIAELIRRAPGSLRGKNLACWCKLCPAHADGKPLGVVCADCAPCHVDLLLTLANPPELIRVRCEWICPGCGAMEVDELAKDEHVCDPPMLD